jgi:integrase
VRHYAPEFERRWNRFARPAGASWRVDETYIKVRGDDLVHGIREQQSRRGKGRGVRLWPWSRMTGWRAARAVMAEANLSGPHASPKGLRHGFGVTAVSAGIPLNLVQKWLGHAQLTTTAIYANAVGAEEQDIARKMWG